MCRTTAVKPGLEISTTNDVTEFYSPRQCSEHCPISAATQALCGTAFFKSNQALCHQCFPDERLEASLLAFCFCINTQLYLPDYCAGGKITNSKKRLLKVTETKAQFNGGLALARIAEHRPMGMP